MQVANASLTLREVHLRKELNLLEAKVISVSSLAVQAGLSDGILVFRPKATEMFKQSLTQFGNPLIGDVYRCDLSGIVDCSGSFVDEFILGWQRLIRQTDNTILILANISEDVEYTIVSALNLRNKIDKDNLILVAKEGNKYNILGEKMERNTLDVFELMSEGVHVTARMVADFFSIELNSAGNRLKKLYDAHATMRLEQNSENGGKYEYYLPPL